MTRAYAMAAFSRNDSALQLSFEAGAVNLANLTAHHGTGCDLVETALGAVRVVKVLRTNQWSDLARQKTDLT